MKSVGLQQTVFYQGLVEDVMDPEELGRVRVRVLGVHSENTSDIPTAKLPWAPIVLPPTEAAIDGIGMAPVGLVPGSWVLVVFADGIFCQSPVVVGSLNGVNPSQIQKPAEVKPEVEEPKTYPPATPSDLGHISEKYESGGKGPGTISTGKGDAGGKSYGSHQLAIKTGTLADFVRQSKFKSEFAGVALGSDEFDAKWKKLATNNLAEFKEDQRLYIEKTHFVPCVAKLAFLDIGERGVGISEMVWSYAVQYGPSRGASRIKRALNQKNCADLSDADIIELCYTDRIINVPVDFKSSPTIHPGLVSRFKNEKKDVLALAASKPSKGLKVEPVKTNTYGDQDLESAVVYKKKSDASPGSVKGFVDPTGKRPTKAYLGQANTNKLARGKDLNKTIQRKKKQTLVKGNGFVEPHVYGAKYPYNRVMESRSGHIIELDDTEGVERVHVYHRSGAFIEFHPDGTIVKKSMKDDNEIVISNKSVYVFGDSNVFVEGNVSLKTLGSLSYEAEGDMTFRCSGSMKMEASGNVEISSGSDLDVYAAGTTTMVSKEIKQNPEASSKEIVVDVGARIQLAKEAAETEEPERVDDWGYETPGSQIVASKEEIDKESGFVTQTGPATTEPKTIETKEAAIVPPTNTNSIEETEVFKGSFKLSDSYCLSDLTTGVAAFKYPLREQGGMTEKEIVKNMSALAANVLEPIRAHFGKAAFIITNSFRHVKEGAKKSAHHKGAAVDLQFPGNNDNIVHIAQEIRQLLPSWTQIILEYHANSPVIHISWEAGKLRKEVFSSYTTTFSGMPKGIRDKNQNLIYA